MHCDTVYSQECAQPVGRMLRHAYTMYSSRAYLHQYEKYGMQAPDFDECFAGMEEMFDTYNML
jgi:tubulin delta